MDCRKKAASQSTATSVDLRSAAILLTILPPLAGREKIRPVLSNVEFASYREDGHSLEQYRIPHCNFKECVISLPQGIWFDSFSERAIAEGPCDILLARIHRR